MVALGPHAVLARLREWLTRDDFRQGQLVLLTGGVGSGKTAALRNFVEYATSLGVLALAATASGDEWDLPFGVAEQLFNHPDIPHQIAARIDAQAQDLQSPVPPVARLSDLASSRPLHELCTSLRDLVRQQPVVIAIDDAQLTDEASLILILAIQRCLASHRLLIVLAGQHWSGLAQPTFLSEAVRLPHERLFLAPMSPQAIETMLAPSPTSLDHAHRAALVHRRTGGSPMLVRALIEDDEWDEEVLGGGGAESPAVMGPIFQEAVVSCLRRSGPEASDVARGIGLLGPDATLASLSRLLNMPEPNVGRQLRVLDRAGLVVGYAFRHPSVAAVVLGTAVTVPLSALSVGDLLLSLADHRSAAVEEVADGSRPAIDRFSQLLYDAAYVPHAGAERASGVQDKSHTYVLLLRALATGDPGQREEHLKDLVVHLLASGARGELALTPTELRRGWLTCQRTAEQTAGAKRAAEAQVDASGAALLAVAESLAGPEAGVAGDGRAAELSEAEHRVAELAAHGLSNREISRRLWITISTVEQHLTRIYRKLGVNGRANIAAADHAPKAEIDATTPPADSADVDDGVDRRHRPPARGPGGSLGVHVAGQRKATVPLMSR